jgi:two-component system sensor histidine kinase DegS
VAIADEQARSQLTAAQQTLARQQRETELLIEQMRMQVQREDESVGRVRAKLETLEQTLSQYSREELRQLFQAAKDRELRLVRLRAELEGLQFKRTVLADQQRLLARLGASGEGAESGADESVQSTEGDLGALLQAQEADSGRLAHWLHDRVAQPLNSLVLQIELWERRRKTDPEQAERELESLRPLAATVLQDARRAIFELRPMSLDDLGLLPTLDRYVQLRSEQEQIVTRIQSRGRVRPLPSVVETAIFRIVGAALDNVRDHSGVTEALVTLAFSDRECTVTIADTGRGCNLRLIGVASQGGTGLIGMRERAHQIGGTIEFKSDPGRGMTVILTVPLVGPVAAAGAGRRRSLSGS